MSELVLELANIVDVIVDSDDRAHIQNYAPDSSDTGGVTEPGSPWSDECHRRLCEIVAALPPGWAAHWEDDDIILERKSPCKKA